MQGSRICCRKATNPKTDLKGPQVLGAEAPGTRHDLFGPWSKRGEHSTRTKARALRLKRTATPSVSRMKTCEKKRSWLEFRRAVEQLSPSGRCPRALALTLPRWPGRREREHSTREESSEDRYLLLKRLRDHRTDCPGAGPEPDVSSEGAARKARHCEILSGKQRMNVRKQMIQCYTHTESADAEEQATGSYGNQEEWHIRYKWH